ncbi:MAG: DUF1365 domain-containing protein [Rhizobacter sp.]|nr:DUF1365 domain-containing protein [Rhizobacter sp.]
MHSAIYRGWLDHRRLAPKPHAFRQRLFMFYLDLGELDRVFHGRWLWSTRRPALARFDRRDHLGDPAQPLDDAVRELVAARTGRRPAGPVRLLTHVRTFGYVFNPVSFYYCFDAGGGELEAVVAEVTNTPWGERHWYVLRPSIASAPWLVARTPKGMHVSPFHSMELEYEWRLSVPAAALAVHMALRPAAAAAEQAPVFGATLALERRPLTSLTLASHLLRFPFMTAQVIGAIHWQALRLWLKRVPVHVHPATLHARPTEIRR